MVKLVLPLFLRLIGFRTIIQYIDTCVIRCRAISGLRRLHYWDFCTDFGSCSSDESRLEAKQGNCFYFVL